MEDIKDILKLEENIEKYYLRLMELEIQGLKNSSEYEQIKVILSNLIQKEKRFLYQENIIYSELKEKIEDLLVGVPMPINLGYHVNAPLFRFHYLLEIICGDSGVLYASTLTYDKNRIIMKVLEYMIDNDYYSEYKEVLIRLKYDKIFMDYNIEGDFILDNDTSFIILDSRSLRDDTPSYRYVDRVLLIDEIEEYIEKLYTIENHDLSYSLAFVYLLEIEARLALCEEPYLTKIILRVQQLLDSNSEYQAIALDLSNIFKTVQYHFSFTR